MFERLTIKTDICIEPENEIVYHNPNDPEGMYNILDLAECLYSGGEAEAGILMEISNRLAAYEDTELTPEQVATLKAENEMLKSLTSDILLDRLEEICKAYKEDRILILPKCQKCGLVNAWSIGKKYCDRCGASLSGGGV